MQPTSWKYVCAIGATTYVKMCRWTHDASERLGKAAVYDAARGRIERGAVPESLGLPNVGIPEPVPALRPSALPGRGTDSGPGTALENRRKQRKQDMHHRQWPVALFLRIERLLTV